MKEKEEISPEGKRITAFFFRYENGTEPVRNWLKSELNIEDRKKVGSAIALVEYEWPIGSPLVKKVGNFWEVRTEVSTGWARVFFVVDKSNMYLLHGVIKKSKQPHRSDIEITLKRLSLLIAGRRG